MVEHTEIRENTNCYTPRILLENMEGTDITSKVVVVVSISSSSSSSSSSVVIVGRAQGI